MNIPDLELNSRSTRSNSTGKAKRSELRVVQVESFTRDETDFTVPTCNATTSMGVLVNSENQDTNVIDLLNKNFVFNNCTITMNFNK